jgi:hypothetical protein
MMKPWQAPLNKPPSKGGKEEGFEVCLGPKRHSIIWNLLFTYLMAIPNLIKSKVWVSPKFKRDNNEEDDELPPNLPTELRYSTFWDVPFGWMVYVGYWKFKIFHAAQFSTSFLSSIPFIPFLKSLFWVPLTWYWAHFSNFQMHKLMCIQRVSMHNFKKHLLIVTSDEPHNHVATHHLCLTMI